MTSSAGTHRWTDRTCLVTGAASGIGQATARELARLGSRVMACDVNETGLQTTVREFATRAEAVKLDVTRESDWVQAIEHVQRDLGQLDVLIHCAGISAGSPIHETSLEDWRRILSVNLDGAFLAAKHAVRVMRGQSTGGSIVLVSSASGLKAAGGAAAYSVSKAGVCMLSQAVAKECRDANLPIRINTVCPAGVKTPMWTTMPFFQDMVKNLGSEEAAYAAMSTSPGEKFAEPRDIVTAILFLASDESRFITGHDLLVDAGYTL